MAVEFRSREHGLFVTKEQGVSRKIGKVAGTRQMTILEHKL